MKSRFAFGRCLLVVAALVVVVASASGRIIRVQPNGNNSSDGSTWALAKKTVSAAITASISGDQIWVAGSAAKPYKELVTLKSGVAVYGGFAGSETQLSQRNWVTNVTVLDGQQGGSVVTVPSSATASTVLDGFTVQNGKSSHGGGIDCENASPTLANLIVTSNLAYVQFAIARGGGLYLFNSNAVLNNVSATNDTAQAVGQLQNGEGGGVCIVGGAPTLTSVSATACSSKGDPALGGGLYCEDATVTMSGGTFTQSTLTGGSSGVSGSGIYGLRGTLTLTAVTVTANLTTRGFHSTGSALALDQCVFSNNSAGGGMEVLNCTGFVSFCSFTGNDAGTDSGGAIRSVNGSVLFIGNQVEANNAQAGGGIYAEGTGVQFVSNVVLNNTATQNGGGFALGLGSVELINNTVSDKPSGKGGAVFTQLGHPVLASNILYASTYGVNVLNGVPTFSHNDVYNNTSGNYVGVSNQTGTNGNISSDPKFVNITSLDAHLMPKSPCVDVGDDSYILPEWLDADGNPRVLAAHVDIGAYERPVQQLLHVRSSNPTAGVTIGVSPADNNGLADAMTPFDRTYDNGTAVTLTAPATAPNGNLFVSWTTGETTRAVTVTVNAETTMTANYVAARHLHVRSSNPDTGVTLNVSPNDYNGQGSGTTSFDRTYVDGSQVTVTAPAAAPNGNVFVKWLSGETTLSLSFTLTADKTVTAVYIPTHTLSVRSSTPGSGVVITVSPADRGGQTSGTTPFDLTYNENTPVTLTAPATAPNANVFVKWQKDGADFGTGAQVSVTVDASHTMTAVYQLPPRNLHLRSSGTPSGVFIQVSPLDSNGHSSGTTPFDLLYSSGTAVTLTAPATASGTNCFLKWQLDAADLSSSQQITLTLDADHTLTAIYVPLTVLHVTSSNPSTGVAIAVSPTDTGGLGGGTAPFDRHYCQGTAVTLTAPAASPTGSVFVRWTKDGVTLASTLQVTVTMDADHTLSAVYMSLRTISIASSFPDAGVLVSVNPADYNALGDGTTPFVRSYLDGSQVTLTAPAVAGQVPFLKWQRDGVDIATSQSITFTANADHAMTAVYRGPQTITGRLFFGNFVGTPPSQVLFELRNPGQTTAFNSATVSLATDGTFTLTAPAMVLDLSVKNTHWLRLTIQGVDTTTGNANVGDQTLKNGDVDNDNTVGLKDLSTVLKLFQTTDAMADLDGNGTVGIGDLAIVLKNFSVSGNP